MDNVESVKIVNDKVCAQRLARKLLAEARGVVSRGGVGKSAKYVDPTLFG